MNSLIITVCVLIEATVIIAQSPRFPATSPPEMLNPFEIGAGGFETLYKSTTRYPLKLPLNKSVTRYPLKLTKPPYNTDTGSLVHVYVKNVDNQFSIVKQASDGPNPDGSYSYSYETGNGVQAQENGHLNNVGTDQEALEARGSYSYTDNEGNTFQVSYVANENGFQPEGAHLPSVPLLIKRALQYIAEHPEENEKK